MKKTVLCALLVSLSSFIVLLSATERDNAKILVNRAAAYVKYQGKDKALKEIGTPKGMFDKGEVYVFAYDLQGVMLAHPKNASLVGQNLLNVPDVEGKLFRKEIVEKAKSQGSGWVDYIYLNPETNKQEHKTTYFRKAQDVIVCAGIYTDYTHEGD